MLIQRFNMNENHACERGFSIQYSVNLIMEMNPGTCNWTMYVFKSMVAGVLPSHGKFSLCTYHYQIKQALMQKLSRGKKFLIPGSFKYLFIDWQWRITLTRYLHCTEDRKTHLGKHSLRTNHPGCPAQSSKEWK